MTITKRVTIILLFIGAATWLAAARVHVSAQVDKPGRSAPEPKPSSTPARRPVAKPPSKTNLSTFSFETVYANGWMCRAAIRNSLDAGDRNYNFGFRVVVSARIP